MSQRSVREQQASLTARKIEENGPGRSLEELLKTRDQLKGAEAQRLRGYFTSHCMEPGRDLDSLGTTLYIGDLPGVKAHFERRVNQLDEYDDPRQAAVNELATLQWGPTCVRIFNLLLLSTIILPGKRQYHLNIMRYLVDIGVPVDLGDVSESTALAHSLSTKPMFDPEIAQILLDAGGDINERNRYGLTCGHEICMVWVPDLAKTARATTALKYFLSHGDNVDIKENDGVTARATITVTPWLEPLRDVMRKEDERRKTEGCTFCGLGKAELLLKCSRCRRARYCRPPKGCQKGEWARHKAECKGAIKAP